MKREIMIAWIKTNGQLSRFIIDSWDTSYLKTIYDFLRLALLADTIFITGE